MTQTNTNGFEKNDKSETKNDKLPANKHRRRRPPKNASAVKVENKTEAADSKTQMPKQPQQKTVVNKSQQIKTLPIKLKQKIDKPPVATTGETRRRNSGSGNYKLKIIPLGGLGEIGKNMTAFEYNNSIIIVDVGIMFPEDSLPGIDFIIPDYSYLLEKKENIEACLLTHGHEDHIGGVPFLLNDMQMPVYGSTLTLGLLKAKLQERKLPGDLHTVKPRQVVNIGPFKAEFIRVSHSIPDSMALAIHTPVGTVLMVSDFKMDMTPIDGQLMDFGRISALGEKGVLLLMADSTNVEKKGFTESEKSVGYTFDKIFFAAKGRIIVTSFASNVHRVQQVIWSAAHCGRKVAIVGRGMQNVTTIARELGYLDMDDDILIDIEKINNLPANKVLIITTGSQGEPLSGLTRMASGEHKQVHIIPGDVVVVSASPIPGNERTVGRTIDNLFRQGATVYHEKGDAIHVSGHASREELKVLLNMVKPKYFMPIHGEYRMLVKHAQLAQELGIDAENTFVMENGQVLELTNNSARVNGAVHSGRVLVDGLGVGDVGNTILKERRILSEDGILLVNLVFTTRKNSKILAGPEIISKGFIFEKEYEHIIDEAKEKVLSLCTPESLAEVNINELRGAMRTTLGKLFIERIGRRPVIIPIITKV